MIGGSPAPMRPCRVTKSLRRRSSSLLTGSQQAAVTASAGTNGSLTRIFAPKTCSRSATRRPMVPKPMMPTFEPRSSGMAAESGYFSIHVPLRRPRSARDHQADGVFRDGDGVVRRAVDHADAVLVRGLQVDVFHASACREDVAELRRGLKHLARDGKQMAENDLRVLQTLQLLLRGQERVGTARLHPAHDIAELVALFRHVPVKRIIRRDPRCGPDRLIEDRGREKKISNCNCFHNALLPFLFSRLKDRR